MKSAATPSQRSWRHVLADLLAPWMVLLYAWWLGVYWTLIGLGAVYLIGVLIATGMTIESVRSGDV